MRGKVPSMMNSEPAMGRREALAVSVLPAAIEPDEES